MIGTHDFSVTELALRIHESAGSVAAFHVLVAGVREVLPLRRAWWVGREPAEAWPDEAEPPAGPA
ncbi:MAG TPA: hypothetical protein VHG93_11705, partial [Longimicrobium sp.]|nr:hypothetical protein [Longimicrobium sp.]